MNSDLVCWKCGATLIGQPLPLGRRDECPGCRAELHVCHMCRHYDARRARQCRELAADGVQDKTRVNDCGWFVPRPDAYQGGGAAVWQHARGALDALFDGATRSASAGSPDDIFKK
jgi:hypothetical protein